MLRPNPLAVVTHNGVRWPRILHHLVHVALGLPIALLAQWVGLTLDTVVVLAFLVALLDKCVWLDLSRRRVVWTGWPPEGIEPLDFIVRNLSQARAWKQAPGLPDLWCMHCERPIAFWWESKRQVGGAYSAAQLEFADDCRRCGVGYGSGDRYAAEAYLVALGLAINTPHGLEPVPRTAGPLT